MCDSGSNMQGNTFNTPLNTMGIGDAMPAGVNGQCGSGDVFTTGKRKPCTKDKIKNNGEDRMFPPLIVYKK